jgi:tellurite resistance protein TehA-like permease
MATLPVGSFAFVMATGIVSIAAARLGYRKLAEGLFAVNLIAFPLLWMLIIVRLARHGSVILAGLADGKTAASFLTTVAATSLIGDQFVLLASGREVAAALWLCALSLWVGLIYAFFAVMTIKPVKPPLAASLDGTWLLAVVATEALAILGTHVAGAFFRPDIVICVSLCSFLLGIAFYLILISLILRRWFFEPMLPEQLTPSYWINMGAAAIAALAGAKLLAVGDAYPLAAALAPLIAGATVLAWAIATWWIPLLLILTIWRHLIGRVSLSYRLDYWSMVFPLGMYTAATCALSQWHGTEFLAELSQAFIWIALASWLLIFLAMLRHLSRLLKPVASGTPFNPGA